MAKQNGDVNSNSEIIVLGEEDFHHSYHGATENVEYIQDSGLITEGMYAVVKEVPLLQNAPYQYLSVGDVLLIEQLKFADGKLHTVVLKDHPRNCLTKDYLRFSYLFDDFLAKFDVISQKDGEAIREQEIASINRDIDEASRNLDEIKAKPQKLNQICFDIYSRRLNSPGVPQQVNMGTNITKLLGSSNALEQIKNLNSQVNMAQDLIEIRENYLVESMSKLNALMSSVMPYMTEKHIALVASTTEVRENSEQINDGLETLNLYSLKGVEIFTIAEGEEADSNICLTLVQKRLLADVELAFFKEKTSETLDVNTAHLFFDELKSNPKLVSQIFPTERCALVMALRDSYIDYKDPFYSMVMNSVNRQVFLLVRNGGNIHVVYSPISSHLAACNLFPSKTFVDEYFTGGTSEIEVTIDSLNYSDVLSEIDKQTLHYKRFLILLAGLQHNKNLLGSFYPVEESFNIFYPPFQEKYFNFIYDDSGDGLIGTEKLKPLSKWVADKNSLLRKGSTIVCSTTSMIRPKSAGACFRRSLTNRSNDGYQQVKWPLEKVVYTTVEQDKDCFFVKIECDNRKSYRDEVSRVNARIVIDETNRGDDGEIQYLVLDGITSEELDAYIADRESRAYYNKYVWLFKRAKAYLEDQKLKDPRYNYYMDAISHIQDKKDVSPVVIESLVRDSINFMDGCKEPIILNYLNSVLSIGAHNKFMEQLSNLQYAEGEELVCIRTDAKGRKYVYTTMPSSLQLNMLTPHAWLYRKEVGLKGGKFQFISETQICSLMKYHRDERMIHVVNESLFKTYSDIPYEHQTISYYDGVKYTANMRFETYEAKLEMVELLKFSKEALEKIYSNTVDRALVERLMGAVKELDKDDLGGKEIAFPVGIGGQFDSILRISFMDSLKWLYALDEQYRNTPDADLIVQDNSHLIFGGSYHSNNFGFKDSDLLINGNLMQFAHEEASMRSLAYALNWALRSYGVSFNSEEDGLKFHHFDKAIKDLAFDYDIAFGNKIFKGQPTKLHYLYVSYGMTDLATYKHVNQRYELYIGETDVLEKIQADKKAEITEFNSKIDTRKYSSNAYVYISNEYILSVDDSDFRKLCVTAKSRIPKDESKGAFSWDAELKCFVFVPELPNKE